MRNTERTLLFSSNAGNVTSCNLSEPLSAFERVCIKTQPNVEWETWVTADAGNHRLNTFDSYSNDGYMVWPTNFNITNGTKTITVNRFQLLMQQATNTGLNLFGWNNTAGNIKRIGAVWGVNRKDPIETEGLGKPQGEGWKEYNETLLWSGTDYANQWVVNLSGRALEYERLKVGVGSHGESPNFIEVDAPTTYDSQLPLYSWWGTSTGSFWYDNHIYKWGNETRTISAISGKGWNLGTGTANPYTTTGLYNTTDTYVRRPLFAIWGINHKSPHKLTLIDSINGSITADRLTGYEFDTSNLSYTANRGWDFTGYDVTGATVTNNILTFQDQNGSVQAGFSAIPAYTITILPSEHGTVVASMPSGYRDEIVSLTSTPDTGWYKNGYLTTGCKVVNDMFVISANAIIQGKYRDTEITILDFYPIGSYFTTKNADFDPNVEWGGEWELDTNGKVTRGGTTVGQTGGEINHATTVNELPGHTHTTTRWMERNDKGTNWGNDNMTSVQDRRYGSSGITVYKGNRTTTSCSNTSNSHNNVQKSLICKRWHRVG